MTAQDATDAKIWVDGDACPTVIKDILFRAAERAQVHVTLVANRALRCPPSRYIHALQVHDGFDVADSEIVSRLRLGDLAVTQDIPLAARVIEKGGVAISPRGERYTRDNMAERLSMRNFMEDLRNIGVYTNNRSASHARERQSFANELDGWLVERSRQK